MRPHLLALLCIVAAVVATPALAKTKPDPAQSSQIDQILKMVSQMQSDVKALQTTVANLAASQNTQATQLSAQLKDVARRLYATCVLTQRQMDITVPGTWSENMLCNYRGLTAAGQAVTQDIFGQNPTNIDTAFGGP
jgi:hypothetical protein